MGTQPIRELIHPNLDPTDPASYEDSCVVEIDEYLAFHSPGDGRRTERQVWVLGIFDWASDEVRTFQVHNRTASILIPIIIENIATTPQNPTRIYTDGWAAYNRLNDEGFDHHVVPHNDGFGIGSETTNHIESFWSQLRHIIEFEYGVIPTDEENIGEYLDTAN